MGTGIHDAYPAEKIRSRLLAAAKARNGKPVSIDDIRDRIKCYLEKSKVRIL